MARVRVDVRQQDILSEKKPESCPEFQCCCLASCDFILECHNKTVAGLRVNRQNIDYCLSAKFAKTKRQIVSMNDHKCVDLWLVIEGERDPDTDGKVQELTRRTFGIKTIELTTITDTIEWITGMCLDLQNSG